ncbi:MAG: ABC transporter permease [Defluviitaleaceae bacterium]|nr:ABC transporter permease [Defluviitaleaceae bacterium]
MHLWENIQLALEGLRANKMRSLLTMLGIIIGIGAVIGIVTVGDSMTAAVTGEMAGLGVSNITVRVDPRGGGGTMGAMTDVMGGSQAIPQEHDLITNEMIERFVEFYPNEIRAVGLQSPAGIGQVESGRLSSNINLMGVNAGYGITGGVNMLDGSFIGDGDVASRRFVAVVSDIMVANIFPDGTNPLNQEIRVAIGNRIETFIVMGVFEHTTLLPPFVGGNAVNPNARTNLYIPISTANFISGNSNAHQNFTVMVQPHVNVSEFTSTTTRFFNSFYNDNPRFRVGGLPMDRVLSITETVMDTISIAVAVIAGISLIVGGVGVMNIMLVSVTERTREIGTRKALGARNSSIRAQFIVEAVIICAIGGILGVGLGFGLGYIGSTLLGQPTMPTVFIIVVAVLFSMIIGLFFGYYPANKAAKLDPIEALRYE